MKNILLILFSLFLGISANAQIRNKSTSYAEIGIGAPIYANEKFGANFKEGVKLFHFGLAIGTRNNGYNRLIGEFKKELVNGSTLMLNNISLKYAHESMVYTGHHHMSYLGLFYGVGLANESINHLNESIKNKSYVLGLIGVNYEKFISKEFGIFLRAGFDVTPMPISENLKSNGLIGLKIKI